MRIKVVLLTIIVIFIIMIIIRNIILYTDTMHIKKMKEVDNRYQILEEMTQYIADISAKNNVKLIPTYGTLLGLVREREILKHDFDTDFALMEDDWKRLRDVLKSQDIYTFEETKILWHRKMILKHVSGLSSDISLLYEKDKTVDMDTFIAFSGSGMRNGSFLWKTPTRVKFDKNMVLPLKPTPTKYGGLYYPNNVDKLLEYWYDDWKTPLEY